MLVLTAVCAFAAGPKVVYTKSFPGSTPAYVSISVEKDGSVAYTESKEKDDDPETFKIEPAAAMAMFELAETLNHFKGNLESGLKVANMGQKTLRWENGSETSESKFNYSLDENARALHDWFEKITESELLAVQLRRAIRYDKLGVNDAILRIHASWDRKRLVGLQQLIPLLDRVAKDESYLHMARERAMTLADLFRGALKPPAQ